jgi:hypothetical protein
MKAINKLGLGTRNYTENLKMAPIMARLGHGEKIETLHFFEIY